MRLGHLSPSSIKCHKDCQFKWLCNYHLKERIEFRRHYAASLGSHMHEVFEMIAREKLTKDNWAEWSLDKEAKLYADAAVKHPGVENIPGKVTADCKMIFDLLFNRDPIFNPLEAGNKIIGIEKKFEYDVEGTPARIKGFIDLVVELDEDTIEVYDWKTGSYAMNYDTARKDPQVLLYFLSARHLFPQYKHVIVTLDYLQKKPVTIPLSDTCIPGIKQSLSKHWRLIKNNNDPRRHEKPIWVCKCFCSREKCDELWSIYQNMGGLYGFTTYMDQQYEERLAKEKAEEKEKAVDGNTN